MKKNNNVVWSLIANVGERGLEYKEFINAFADMIGNNLSKINNTNYRISISIGAKRKKYFQEYLNTVFKNPVVIITNYNNCLQITIRSFNTYNGGKITLTLDMIKNLYIKKISEGNILIYEIDFKYEPNNMDYHIQIVCNDNI